MSTRNPVFLTGSSPLEKEIVKEKEEIHNQIVYFFNLQMLVDDNRKVRQNLQKWRKADKDFNDYYYR